MKRRVWSAAASAMTVAMGAGMGAAMLALYRQGLMNRAASGLNTTPLLTREGVALALRSLLPLFLLWLVTMIASALAGGSKKAAAIVPDNAFALKRLRAGADVLPEDARREEAFRRRIGAICALVTAGLAAVALTYLFNPRHFDSWDLETVMGGVLLRVVPCAVAAFVVWMTAVRLFDRSRQREISALKSAGHAMARAPLSSSGACRGIIALRTALMLAAIAMIALGVVNGGLHDVLVKAINICTECIGLG